MKKILIVFCFTIIIIILLIVIMQKKSFWKGSDTKIAYWNFNSNILGTQKFSLAQTINKNSIKEGYIAPGTSPKNCTECKVLKINRESKQISSVENDFITYRIPINEKFEIYAETTDNSNKKYSSEKININNIEKFIEKNKKYNNEDLNTFSNPGYYEIKVTDNADNQICYTIKIEK